MIKVGPHGQQSVGLILTRPVLKAPMDMCTLAITMGPITRVPVRVKTTGLRLQG